MTQLELIIAVDKDAKENVLTAMAFGIKDFLTDQRTPFSVGVDSLWGRSRKTVESLSRAAGEGELVSETYLQVMRKTAEQDLNERGEKSSKLYIIVTSEIVYDSPREAPHIGFVRRWRDLSLPAAGLLLSTHEINDNYDEPTQDAMAYVAGYQNAAQAIGIECDSSFCVYKPRRNALTLSRFIERTRPIKSFCRKHQ